MKSVIIIIAVIAVVVGGAWYINDVVNGSRVDQPPAPPATEEPAPVEPAVS